MADWAKIAAYLDGMDGPHGRRQVRYVKLNIALWDDMAASFRSLGIDPVDFMVPRPDGD